MNTILVMHYNYPYFKSQDVVIRVTPKHNESIKTIVL